MTKTNAAVKTATAFEIINSKAVVSSKGLVTFPIQLGMTLNLGAQSQKLKFGYSRLGGRKPFVVAEGKAPVAMTKKDFIDKLKSTGITNLNQVVQKLNGLKAFYRDEFVVAKCEKCETGLVTAANVDYIQRWNANLTVKLGYTVTPFSCICLSCQGAPSRKTEKPATVTTTRIPATATAPKCAACTKDVKSSGVAKFSLRKFGKVLCYGKCQEAEAVIPEVKVEPTNVKVDLTVSMIHAIMKLEVDASSPLSELQAQLKEAHAGLEPDRASAASTPLSAEPVVKPLAESVPTVQDLGAPATELPALPCEACTVTGKSMSGSLCEDCWADAQAPVEEVSVLTANEAALNLVIEQSDSFFSDEVCTSCNVEDSTVYDGLCTDCFAEANMVASELNPAPKQKAKRSRKTKKDSVAKLIQDEIAEFKKGVDTVTVSDESIMIPDDSNISFV